MRQSGAFLKYEMERNGLRKYDDEVIEEFKREYDMRQLKNITTIFSIYKSTYTEQ